MMEKDIIKELSNCKQRLRQEFGIDKIALFGSFARGEAHSKSDVDIVIISMQNKNYFTLLKAKVFLEKVLHKKVDLGFFDALKPYVKDEVRKDLIYV